MFISLSIYIYMCICSVAVLAQGPFKAIAETTSCLGPARCHARHVTAAECPSYEGESC